MILHGVNGVGKTKVLEIVKSALGGNVSRLARLPFREAELSLSDGTSIVIRRTVTESPRDAQQRRRDRVDVNVTYAAPRGTPKQFSYSNDDLAFDSLLRDDYERLTPLVALDDDYFLDSSTGETISVFEAQSRYSELILGFASARRRRYARREVAETDLPPPELAAFWAAANVHLIETQRLLRTGAEPVRRRQGHERGPRQQVPTVTHFSQDLVEKIKTALGDLGRKSQELDRTFPSRLVKTTTSGPRSPSEARVREDYDQQLRLRRRLTRIAVLDEFGADIQLPKKKLDDLILRVMVEFLQDSAEKFQVVEPLLDRLELLTQILNEKFKFKRIEIDRESGFVVKTEGTGTELGPSQLSSGEQHELVLLYDLLFGAADGALVLIDEPEISLHVNWQRRFLADLRKVSHLTSHRFVVATHSPQIVSKFSNRMVQLAEP